jgi:hypothetical protein
MRIGRRFNWFIPALVLLLPATRILGQPASTEDPINKAQREVTIYLAKLADLLCTESVTQEKLSSDGHIESTEHAKYDYLIMMNGNGDEFQLTESRTELSPNSSKQTKLPMLTSNGIATLLVIFHPYYRDGFSFETGSEETVNGRPAIPIHFTHIAGRRTPAALAIRGREYPLELQGTTWLDKQSGQVVRSEASLVHDMSDVGLRSMHIQVDYKSALLGTTEMTFPETAVVDVSTLRQHWRNKHVFDHYRWFSTSTGQDPKVNVHDDTTKATGAATSQTNPPEKKEKP